MVLIPEVLDLGEAVTLRAVLLALGQLLAWLGALALAALAVAIVSTILWPLNKFVSTITFGTVGSVPGSHAVEQFFTNLLGEAAAQVDSAAGSFWHSLKRLVVQVGEEVLGLAILSAYLWWYMETKLPEAIWHRIGKSIHSGVAHAEALARAAEREASRIDKWAHGEVRTLHRDVHRIDATIENTLTPEIKSARELAREAENLAKNAWDAISNSKVGVSAAAVAGVLAAALAAAGFGWLTCRNNPIANSKTPCNEWQRLGDLLGLAVFAATAFDFEALVHEAQDAIGETVSAVDDVLGL